MNNQGWISEIFQRGKEGQDLEIENEACGAPDSNNVERSDNGEEQTKAVVVTNEMEKEEVNLEMMS